MLPLSGACTPKIAIRSAARMRIALLNQARPAFNAWFGVMPEITPALKKAIAATF